VTHRHGDHAKSVKKLIQRGIPVYGPNDLAEAYAGVTVWEPLQYHRIGSMTVLPFAVQHDVECYGYQIETDDGEKLLYITDTAYVPYTFSGLTHIMTEANYSKGQMIYNMSKGRLPEYLVKRIMKSHMSMETLLEMLKANDMISVKQIYLLHLSDMNSNAGQFKELVQRQTGAEVYVF
ncbi:MBL fold metallo-hydrolase, partial [uncultured Megasphaera sp.]|uniref:MBL fold metallo-hydrolase n=1 Tax=uncultured Megasphaera sp. TaxID=165188 RepID=UPI00265D0BD5